MDAYLTVGGIREYLYYLSETKSVLQSLCKHSFKRGAFFAQEFEKIFVSTLGKSRDYKSIIHFLAQNRYGTRAEIAKAVSSSLGGRLSSQLLDLEEAEFI